MFKIKIIKNGPYVIEDMNKIIVESYQHYTNKHILESVTNKVIEVEGKINLCRCGESKNKPFCDGSHVKVDFDGEETADLSSYIERSEKITGPGIDLLDDNRCAFARACHRERGEVWTLTEQSDNNENIREVMEGASACPAGRLTAVKDHQLIEDEYEDTIGLAQDPENGVSASLNIRGTFTLEGANGQLYEQRNRMALCRCGKSQNKPFCDASHVNANFQDSILLK